MDDQSLLRYSRQIMLPELGIEGQQRLCEARALIVGLGGLGSQPWGEADLLNAASVIEARAGFDAKPARWW